MRVSLRELCLAALLTGSVGCSLLFSEGEGAPRDAGPDDTDAMDAAGLPALACGSIEILAGEFKMGVDLSALWQIRNDDVKDPGGVGTLVTPVDDGIEFTLLTPTGRRAGLISNHAFSLVNSSVEIEFETLAAQGKTTLQFTARNIPSSDKSFSVSFENETIPKITISDGLDSNTREIAGPPARWKFSHLEDTNVSIELFDGDGDLLYMQRITALFPIDSISLGLTLTPFSSNTLPTGPTTTKLNRITAPQRVSKVAFCPISDVNDTFEGPELSSLWAHHVGANETQCRTVADGVLMALSVPNVPNNNGENCFVASSKGFLFDSQDSLEVELRFSDSMTQSELHLYLDDGYEKELAFLFDRAPAPLPAPAGKLSLRNTTTGGLVSQTTTVNNAMPLYLRLSRTPEEVLFWWSQDGKIWQELGSISSTEVPIGPYKISLISRDSSNVGKGSTFDNLIGTKQP